jgi:TRAP-type mannitol/chloroaromatic compound transport system permease small subunit
MKEPAGHEPAVFEPPGPHTPAWMATIDRITDACGWLAAIAVIASCLISAGNAFVRYLIGTSSNGWLEIQWYLFAACVMLGAAHVMRRNEHVRVDILYGSLSVRGKAWVDLFGFVCFVLPVMALMIYFSWPLFTSMWASGERSSNSGGLIRWPAMLMLPLGFALLMLQSLAEIGRRIAILRNREVDIIDYERPLQ